MPPYRNYIYEYHAKITSGEIIAGKWIKKIYEIIINGLQKQEYFFNAKAANKAIRFIENFCHHSKGRNDLIKLELWQKAIVYYNCLAMVASGELAAADLLAKIESAENQRYIECGVAAVEEEKKAVTVYYCDEAAVGMKFVAGDVSGTVQGVTHIQDL